MTGRSWPAVVVALLFAACTSAPTMPPPDPGLWQDQAFDLQAHAVTVDESTLFRLDPALLHRLRQGDIAAQHAGSRSVHLLKLVFGPDMKAFAYAGGHSTVAADTWHNQRGDCLSLSIMTLALARALDLKAQVQEVRVPPSFDRRGGVDFLNAHVNVLVSNDRSLRAMNRLLPAGDIVIDFEPQPGTRQGGTPLSNKAVLARFLNNLAAEHMAARRDAAAYAHFKSAILVDPLYAAAYNNLAQLYLRHGLPGAAETLLRRALALNQDSDLALTSLHQLLLAQGRQSEALAYERQLRAQRERDPYYWLGLGIDQLRQGRDSEAVRALERAQSLTTGFEEVHRYLAIAYWRTGQLHKARDQLAVLRALDQGGASVAQLNKKLQSTYEVPVQQ